MGLEGAHLFDEVRHAGPPEGAAKVDLLALILYHASEVPLQSVSYVNCQPQEEQSRAS